MVLPDIIAGIPWELIGFFSLRHARLFSLIRLLFIRRATTHTSLILRMLRNRYHAIPRMSSSVTRLIKLVLAVFLLLHLQACFWFYLTDQHEPYDLFWVTDGAVLQQKSWMLRTGGLLTACWQEGGEGRDCSSIGSKYLLSLYWAATTFSTVGFGDIAPFYTDEVFFTSAVELAGAFTVSIVIAAITSVILSQDMTSGEQEDTLAHLNKYLDRRRNQMEPAHKDKLRHYYDYMFEE
jgi:hypothetical protein